MADFPDKNNGSRYNAFYALNMARQDKNARSDSTSKGKGNTPRVAYKSVLEYVQDKISTNEGYNRVLTESLDSDEAKTGDNLKSIIYSLLQQCPYQLDNDTVDEYKIRIYEDMTGFGLLTPYIEDPNIEEINIFGRGRRGTCWMKGSRTQKRS